MLASGLAAAMVLSALSVYDPTIGLGAVLGGGAVGAIGLGLARSERRRMAARLEQMLGLPGAGSISARLRAALRALERQRASVEPRLLHRHGITQLPTREPLLKRMAEDGAGTLGLLILADFDRMCAFDGALGERTLVAVVERMQRMFAPGRLIAHVDRAHFAIWYGADVSAEIAARELEAVAYALSDAIETEAGTVQPTVRTATDRLEADGGKPETVLNRSLAALSLGAGTPGEAARPIDSARETYEIEQGLRQAIARREFELSYQPLVDAAKGRVIGAEALLRWQHPTLGPISPSRFVPVAEANGLADEIGLWALNTACREAARWRADGLNELFVAVNVSGHQLQRTDILRVVERTLNRHKLPPGALEIELTETVAADDIATTARLFAELRAKGVRISIDDFGTGYSSLSALRQLSFDKLKIDREFVTDVANRADSRAICQSVIALARGLGIRVLAEGVEHGTDYRWLRQHGCHHFQGYYFAPPLSADAFTAYVRDLAGLADLVDTSPNAERRRAEERLRA
jgi:EAL domain-containing protein (putative c-di-GMP-specific phosphodiesterase class I)/GGDEF domain-containing protein